MSEYISFRDYENTKKHLGKFLEEDGLGNKKAGLPNQDIPKANKGPELLKFKDALAGRDYKGNLSTNPVKGTEKDPLPYKGGDVKKGKELLVAAGGEGEGLGSKGNKVQTPSNSIPDGKAPTTDVKVVKGKHKMTSEQFIEQTKNMSPKEFVNFFVEGSDEPLPTVTDLYGNEFTPDPTQTIQYLAALMVKNPRLLTRFVREMKRQEGGMKMLMSESQDHPEFYSLLVEGMSEPEEGRKKCHRISRAMNEQYMSALDKFMYENMNEEVQPKGDLSFEDGGPMGSTPEIPSGQMPPKMVKPQGGAFGGGGPGGEAPQGPPQGGAFGGGGAGAGPEGPVPGGAFGGGSGSPEIGMPGAPPGAAMAPPGGAGAPPPMPPGTASGGAPGFDTGSGGSPIPGMPMPKLKGETAHGNMIEEMGGFPHMFAHMSDYCLNCDKNKK